MGWHSKDGLGGWLSHSGREPRQGRISYSLGVNSPRHILIIRPSALGDVCRTVPVLVSLKLRWPEARIDWLVQRGFEGAILGHPDLHEAIPFDRRALSLRRVATGAWRSAMGDLISRLRTPRYDLVIDAQGLFRSGFFAALTGSRMRVGYARAEEFGSIFYSRRIAVDPSSHAVDRMLALVAGLEVEPVPDMRLYSTPAGRDGLPETLRGARYATFAPTSRWAGKRWPQDRFLEVAKSLLDRGAVERIAVVGGGNEREQCSLLIEYARTEPRIVDLVGRTDVETLMAVIESSAIVLANDSAALHMGVGFDRPLVGLFGPTKIGRVGPYGRSDDVLQSRVPEDRVSHKDEHEGLKLMAEIETERVISAMLDRLEDPRIRSRTHEHAEKSTISSS